MKRNMGKIDRIVRGVVGIILAVVGIIYVGFWWGILLLVIGLILLITAIVGVCLLYMPFKFSTKK
jgi:uncharacterized membrane protein